MSATNAVQQVINLTAHPLTLLYEDGSQRTIDPSGRVARIDMVRTRVGFVLGLPVYEVSQGKVEGIPPPDESGATLYVVSQLIQSACPDRSDLLCPDGTLKRKDRTVIGLRGFTRNAPRPEPKLTMAEFYAKTGSEVGDHLT